MVLAIKQDCFDQEYNSSMSRIPSATKNFGDKARKRPIWNLSEANTEFNNAFKKLRVDPETNFSDHSFDEMEVLDPIPSRLYIPDSLFPGEDTIKRALATDFKDTSLGRLVKQLEDRMPSGQITKPLGKQMIIYQEPVTLAELIKEAAAIDENLMDLD